MTVGVCFCGCLYCKYKRHKLDLFRCRTIEAFNDQARDMGMSNVCQHFATRFLLDAGYWTGSKNHPLEYGRPHLYSRRRNRVATWLFHFAASNYQF